MKIGLLLAQYLLNRLIVILFLFYLFVFFNLSGCVFENNISFTANKGECADGATDVPYCIAVTIQNNKSGQNYINSTSYPINNLSSSIGGTNNIDYPILLGSSYDPNNCLEVPISLEQFYLWASGESLPVDERQAITINTNYTVDDSMIDSSNDTASANITVYEVPELLISSQNGYIQEYNNLGFISPYYADVANSVTNDTYYGLIYLAGNNGIYFSGNGTYIGNTTGASSSTKGVTRCIRLGE